MAKKIDWTNHLIEFITVVVGILLAFGLNNYNENKEERNRANQYLEGIKTEIQDNLNQVIDRNEYHNKLLHGLQTKPLEVLLQLKLSKTKSYAWDLANNEIFKKYVDNDTYYELANIYSRQEVLEETNKEANSAMTQINLMSPYHYISAGSKENAIKILRDEDFQIGTRQGWVPVFQDITSYQADLIEMYQSFLDKHGNEQ